MAAEFVTIPIDCESASATCRHTLERRTRARHGLKQNKRNTHTHTMAIDKIMMISGSAVVRDARRARTMT